MGMIDNGTGTKIDFNAAVNLMDDELRDDMVRAGMATGPITEEEFFACYAVLHLGRFGEVFEPAKPNPVW